MLRKFCRLFSIAGFGKKISDDSCAKQIKLPGKVSPVTVEWCDDDDEKTYLEAHQILVGLIERLRDNPDPEVQGAVAWAETALWG